MTTDETACESVCNLIRSLCHAHRRKYGGDYEELEAEANLHLIQAVRSHDPARGKLTTWVHWQVKHGLLDWARREAKAGRGRVRLKEQGWRAVIERPDHHPRPLLTDTLSGDALTAVDVLLAINRQQPKARLGAGSKFLLSLGWATKRVLKAYDEILDALM